MTVTQFPSGEYLKLLLCHGKSSIVSVNKSTDTIKTFTRPEPFCFNSVLRNLPVGKYVVALDNVKSCHQVYIFSNFHTVICS